MQLKCLFWNTARRPLVDKIADIAVGSDSNFLAFSEFESESNALLLALQNRGLDFYSIPILGCQRIRIFSKFTPGLVHHRREGDRFTIKELIIPGCEPVLIALVHLPSKLYATDIDQLHTATFLKEELERAEVEACHDNTVVFGDFNMNPFDLGMMSAPALNSVPCLVTASRESRVVEGRSHKFFYNPMWNLLGDFVGPAGTFFHGSPKSLSHYWNTLDQVLLRPGLAEKLERNSLTIVTTAGAASLLGENGRPSMSDHLPITFTLNLN